MLLDKLSAYASHIPATPAMYIKTPIRWLLELDETGRYLGPIQTTGKGGKNDRGKEYLAPHAARAAGVKAKLLADNAEYVLGVAREGSKPDRVAQCHAAFKDEVRRCAAATQEPTVQAVLHFLESLDRTALALPQDFDPAQTLTFSVDGVLPIELLTVQKHWARASGGEGDEEQAESAKEPMQCLICGQPKIPLKRLPFKIKRIPNGQVAGMALISANSPAFESYGLEASLIAPSCADCGERFSKAANSLLETPRNRIAVGPIVYVFWTKDQEGYSPASLLSEPDPTEVKSLIESVYRGTASSVDLDPSPFYATAFSASGARVVVRDWLDMTVASVQKHLGRYFALQQLVDLGGGEGKPYGLYALAASTVRDANRDLPASVPKALLHMALKGGPLPMGLLFHAVKRNRAEQAVTRNRIALIKMVLLSNQPDFTPENDTMIELDTTNRTPAYLCGRLLSVLESVQYAALPGIKATITDRFFGTASSAPASVFGRLLRGAQPHLGKLRKERPGVCNALQQRLEEVQAGLSSFPKTLKLEEQGLFALGYYHQRAADRAAIAARKQEREEKEQQATK